MHTQATSSIDTLQGITLEQMTLGNIELNKILTMSETF